MLFKIIPEKLKVGNSLLALAPYNFVIFSNSSFKDFCISGVISIKPVFEALQKIGFNNFISK
jgi:hypothetical protein